MPPLITDDLFGSFFNNMTFLGEINVHKYPDDKFRVDSNVHEIHGDKVITVTHTPGMSDEVFESPEVAAIYAKVEISKYVGSEGAKVLSFKINNY